MKWVFLCSQVVVGGSLRGDDHHPDCKWPTQSAKRCHWLAPLRYVCSRPEETPVRFLLQHEQRCRCHIMKGLWKIPGKVLASQFRHQVHFRVTHPREKTKTKDLLICAGYPSTTAPAFFTVKTCQVCEKNTIVSDNRTTYKSGNNTDTMNVIELRCNKFCCQTNLSSTPDLVWSGHLHLHN